MGEFQTNRLLSGFNSDLAQMHSNSFQFGTMVRTQSPEIEHEVVWPFAMHEHIFLATLYNCLLA
jgi:hypothetical protein